MSELLQCVLDVIHTRELLMRQYRCGPEHQRFHTLNKHLRALLRWDEEKMDGRPWPSESLDYDRQFGQPHAKLFPFIERKVRTPRGVGTLVQVFAWNVTVVLDAEPEDCEFFWPDEIEPVNWEISPGGRK